MIVRSAVAVGFLLAATLLGGCSFGHTKGTMPPPGPNGEIDPRQVPELIAFVGQTDHVIGWVPSAFLLRQGVADDAIPVDADDLATLIGHSVPGKGFVPLGADPVLMTERPSQAVPSG